MKIFRCALSIPETASASPAAAAGDHAAESVGEHAPERRVSASAAAAVGHGHEGGQVLHSHGQEVCRALPEMKEERVSAKKSLMRRAMMLHVHSDVSALDVAGKVFTV